VGRASAPVPPSSGMQVGDPIPMGSALNAAAVPSDETQLTRLVNTGAGRVDAFEKGAAGAASGAGATGAGDNAFGSGGALAGPTGRDAVTYRDPRSGQVFNVKLEFDAKPKAGDVRVVAREDKIQPIMQAKNDGGISFRFKQNAKLAKKPFVSTLMVRRRVHDGRGWVTDSCALWTGQPVWSRAVVK
jgi:hypothetical protein